MDRSGIQRIIPIMIVLIIIVIAVFALFSLAKNMFGGDEAPETDPGRESLVNTAVDRSVRITVRGRIVAQEDFHSYTISVSPISREITTYKGYLGDTIKQKTLTNNSRAYEQFVYALDRVGLMDGKQLEGEKEDRRGICPTGVLYEYEVRQDSNTIKTLWTTSCKKNKGSLTTSNQSVLNLFKKQIPDMAKYTEGLGIY